MSAEWIAVIGIVVMLIMLALRVPVALSMLLVGVVGFAMVTDWNGALQMLQGIPKDVLTSYDFSAIPLFILMGVLAAYSGMAGSLFRSMRIIFGSFRGGLAIAAVGSCGIFASISGSSLATASTMTRVALPEMEKHGYKSGFAAGALAAGGTLGIMIPPSIALLIYAILTEQSVGTMFIAGLLPGLLGLCMYSLTVLIMAKIKPDLVKTGEATAWKDKLFSLVGLVPFGVIFIIIIGGIFKGLFTPTEGAAVGAFASWVYAFMKGMRLKGLIQSLKETLSLSAVIFFMLVGAQALGYLISISRLSFTLSNMIVELNYPPMVIMLCIVAMYFLLGMFMDSIAMLVITVPVLFPVIQTLGIDPVWFGIVSVLAVELGLITPPVGMNVYVIKAVASHISLGRIFKGVFPFVICDLCRLALLMIFPSIALALVHFSG